MRNDIITDEFAMALRDYAYLLNRSYPKKSIRKIIGDRYMLNTFQRVLIARGVFPDTDVRKRIRKTLGDCRGQDLYIDAYNVFFTVCNYLLGRMVFIANDRFVRDAGEVYGKPQEEPVFDRGIEICLKYLEKSAPASVNFYLDSPVSHSAELAGELRQRMSEKGLRGDALIDKNPDALLIRKNDGVIASSDSDVLDHTEQPVLDLAHLVLRDNFDLNLPDLGRFLA